jgi:hypothetical protein
VYWFPQCQFRGTCVGGMTKNGGGVSAHCLLRCGRFNIRPPCKRQRCDSGAGAPVLAA